MLPGRPGCGRRPGRAEGIGLELLQWPRRPCRSPGRNRGGGGGGRGRSRTATAEAGALQAPGLSHAQLALGGGSGGRTHTDARAPQRFSRPRPAPPVGWLLHDCVVVLCCAESARIERARACTRRRLSKPLPYHSANPPGTALPDGDSNPEPPDPESGMLPVAPSGTGAAHEKRPPVRGRSPGRPGNKAGQRATRMPRCCGNSRSADTTGHEWRSRLALLPGFVRRDVPTVPDRRQGRQAVFRRCPGVLREAGRACGPPSRAGCRSGTPSGRQAPPRRGSRLRRAGGSLLAHPLRPAFLAARSDRYRP